MRNRVKDMQDDIRVMKRHLKIEDVEGEKRMKFAIDPTQGRPGDYAKEDLDLGSQLVAVSSKATWKLSKQLMRFNFGGLSHECAWGIIPGLFYV